MATTTVRLADSAALTFSSRCGCVTEVIQLDAVSAYHEDVIGES
jgi:hypothetical protein